MDQPTQELHLCTAVDHAQGWAVLLLANTGSLGSGPVASRNCCKYVSGAVVATA